MATYNPIEIRPLESESLLLTPTKLEDAPAIQKQFANFEVLKYMARAIPWPYPPDGAAVHVAKVLQEMEKRKTYSWSIRLTPGLPLIGVIALTPDSEEDHRGFWLALPHWGKGLMTEAVARANDFAFDELEMEHLLLNNAQPNVASHRLKESWGAKIIGITQDVEFIGGRFPSVRWRLDRDAWREVRGSKFQNA